MVWVGPKLSLHMIPPWCRSPIPTLAVARRYPYPHPDHPVLTGITSLSSYPPIPTPTCRPPSKALLARAPVPRPLLLEAWLNSCGIAKSDSESNASFWSPKLDHLSREVKISLGTGVHTEVCVLGGVGLQIEWGRVQNLLPPGALLEVPKPEPVYTRTPCRA